MIHVLRPYANEDEYLASERFSIDAKSMLLIDQPLLPLDTAVLFDIQLANGDKPIRAEAKVIGHVAPSAERPGGLRVRFKRFGAATKAFIDRATAQAAAPAAERAATFRPASALVGAPVAPGPALAQPALAPLSPAEPSETSGIHRRPVVPVAAPVNREELLERLRHRARGAARLSEANPGEQTG